jgi:ATP-binding cassette, subfamily B, multidrug efflux pump
MKELLKILRFWGPYTGKLILAFFLLLISSGVMLMQPKLAEYAVDIGISGGNIRAIVLFAGIILATAAISSVFMYISGVLTIRSSQGASYDLRNSLFQKITSFSFANFDRLRTGELMVRLNSDVNMVRMFFRMGFFMIIQAVMLLIGAVILMFITNVRLAVIMTIIMAGIMLLFGFFSIIIRPMFMKVREALDRLNNTLQESLSGIKLVRSFAKQDREKEKFNTRNTNFYALSIRAGVIVSIIMPFLLIAGNLSMAAVLSAGGKAVAASDLTLGQLTAFNNYAMMAVFPIIMLAIILNFMVMASASAGRIWEILITEAAVREKPSATTLPEVTGGIELRNVSFHYGDGENALSGISLRINPGEHIGIIGQTGSGKSTLANCLARFYDVTEGVILLDGKDIRDLTFDTVRETVLVALQESVLFSGTIQDNIRFGNKSAGRNEVIEAARLARAEEFILEKENQWEEAVGERGMGLSGGQRQRIALARALLVRPKILILDDITSALDAQTEKTIIGNLYTKLRNMTTIIISQKINSVRQADKIYVMEDGTIQSSGSHEELLACCPVYREIDATQNADAPEDENE